MELQIVNNQNGVAITEELSTPKNSSSFIEANTEIKSYRDIREIHNIPNFAKDNEQLISHTDFVDTVREAGEYCFRQNMVFIGSYQKCLKKHLI